MLVGIERLVRRKPVTNAVGGVIGTGIAVFIALRSGSAEGYFVPRMLYAAALSLVFAGSVVVRRPLVGYIIGTLYRAPSEWVSHPKVRRVFSEVTLAWSGLFAFRAIVYAVLIAAGKAGWLAFASVAMGWPAFLLLLYALLPLRAAAAGSARRARAPRRLIRAQQRGQLRGGRGAAEVVALPARAALGEQEAELAGGLDALGHDVEPELHRQPEHGGDERRRRGRPPARCAGTCGRA